MNIHDLYVITYWMEGFGILLNSNTVYPTREEAESKIPELQKTEFAITNALQYKAVYLSEYICDANEVRFPIEQNVI